MHWFRVVLFILFVFLLGVIWGCTSNSKKTLSINNKSHTVTKLNTWDNTISGDLQTTSNMQVDSTEVILKTEELSNNIDKAHEHIISFALSNCNTYDLILSWGWTHTKKKIKTVPYLLTWLLENTKYTYSILCNNKVLINWDFYTEKENKETDISDNQYDTKPIYEKEYLPKINYAVFLGKYLKIGFDKPVLIKKVFVYKYDNDLQKYLSWDSLNSAYDCLDSITGFDYDNKPILELFKNYGSWLINKENLSWNCMELFSKLYNLSKELSWNNKLVDIIDYTWDLELLNYIFPFSWNILTGWYKINAQYKYQNLTWQSVYYIYNY